MWAKVLTISIILTLIYLFITIAFFSYIDYDTFGNEYNSEDTIANPRKNASPFYKSNQGDIFYVYKGDVYSVDRDILYASCEDSFVDSSGNIHFFSQDEINRLAYGVVEQNSKLYYSLDVCSWNQYGKFYVRISEGVFVFGKYFSLIADLRTGTVLAIITARIPLLLGFYLAFIRKKQDFRYEGGLCMVGGLISAWFSLISTLAEYFLFVPVFLFLGHYFAPAVFFLITDTENDNDVWNTINVPMRKLRNGVQKNIRRKLVRDYSLMILIIYIIWTSGIIINGIVNY